MDRRRFLAASGAITGFTAAATTFGPGFWQAALAAPAVPGPGPYGDLVPSNLDGVLLPAGFTARVVAVAGVPVGATNDAAVPFVWPPFPDGTATFAAPGGGWVLACNSEVPRLRELRDELGLPLAVTSGGASALVFDADGNVTDAYEILTGTDGNCAGGATPWDTWLSCEEPQIEPATNGVWARGAVFECDPYVPGQGVPYPAMGLFKHEAVAIDPVHGHAFLTEDESDGTFYRFVPTDYPDLSAGVLQVPRLDDRGSVTWHDVADPLATDTRTVDQVPGTARFDGGEGIWYDEGYVYFTTKNDHRVWVHDIARQTITLLYDAADHATTPLGPDAPGGTSVDNVTVSPSGDLFVAEDGGNLEVVLITADTREVAPVLRLVGDNHAGSEICGPSFSPDGTRLYFSSQRRSIAPAGIGDPTGVAPIFGNGMGVTYEVTGPFRTQRVGIAAVGAAGVPEPMAPVSPAPAGSVHTPDPAAAPEPPPARSPVAPVADGGVMPATGAGATATGLLALAAAARLRRGGGDVEVER